MESGIKTLGRIRELVQIDEEWIDRRERGFSWWAHRLVQHIDAGPPIDDDGIVVTRVTRVTSRIPVLRNVRAGADRVEQTLAELNFVADSYCYVYDPETRSVDSVQSGIVHDQTLDWRPGLLAASFIIQLVHAEEDGPVLRRMLGGRLAVSSHPTSGRRKVPDDMLNVVRAVFLPRGTGTNPFANGFEFETICEQANRVNAASFGADATGVAIEVPFGDSTALITLNTQESNPRIGQGLGAFLQLPMFASFAECARLAAWLNRKEAAGEFLSHCIGAWSVRKHRESCTVARCSFTPQALHRPGLAMDAAIGAVMKLRQVNALLNPGAPEPSAWQVVAGRLGIDTPPVEAGGEDRAVTVQ